MNQYQQIKTVFFSKCIYFIQIRIEHYYYSIHSITAQKIGINMAFVFSQPRWVKPKIEDVPGPGSNYPDLNLISQKRSSPQSQKIRKGRANMSSNKQNINLKDRQCEDIDNPVQICDIVSKMKKNSNAKKLNNINSCLNTKSQIGKHKILQLNEGSRIMEIKSLQPAKIIQINNKTHNQQKIQEKQSEQKYPIPLQNALVKKTIASIRPISSQKFYIGSKDENLKKHVKNTRPHTINKIYRSTPKMRSRQDRNLQLQTFQNLSNQTQSRDTQSIELQTHEASQKPNSTKHPFSKNQQLYDFDHDKFQQKQTGIQQQQNSQFMADAVPGPGSYQIGQNARTTKKSMMFTETNKNRFEDHMKNNKITSQFTYIYNPLTSKSKSRAPQSRVGFGSALENIKQKNVESNVCFTDFYEDFKNIQNKSMSVKLRDALNPGFFTSKAPRFTYSTENPTKNVKQSNQTKYEDDSKSIACFKNNKLSHPFNSNVKRQQQNISLTANVDFSGQQYKTIQQKLQNIIIQPDYEQYNAQQATKNEQAVPVQQPQKRQKTHIQIKHQLVQGMNGYRQRQSKFIKKKQIRAYTISPHIPTHQIQLKFKFKANTPAPNQYRVQKNWFKESFNMKFCMKDKSQFQGKMDYVYERRKQGQGGKQDSNLQLLRI